MKLRSVVIASPFRGVAIQLSKLYLSIFLLFLTAIPSLQAMEEEETRGHKRSHQEAFGDEVDGENHYRLAHLAQTNREALDHFHAAAEQGHSEALYDLAMIYEEGQYGAKPNPEMALQFYGRAAAQGSATALKELGDIFCFGKCNTTANGRKAFECYQNAIANFQRQSMNPEDANRFSDSAVLIGFYYSDDVGKNLYDLPQDEAKSRQYNRLPEKIDPSLFANSEE